MALLQDIIPAETKKKLKNIKDMNITSTTIKGKIGSGAFVGATPDLNSSLGMNAADGAIDTPVVEEPSKLAAFWNKNSTLITGIGGALLGGSSSPAPTGGGLPPEKKKGLPAWAWILIVVIVIVIIVLIVKKMRK